MYYLETVCDNENRNVCLIDLYEDYAQLQDKLQAKNWKRFVISEISFVRIPQR